MTMKAISGVELMDSHIDLDRRGDLVVFEEPGDRSFAFERAFDMRDGLMRHLSRCGIGSGVHHAPGLQHHPAFPGGADAPLPVTDALAQSLLSLPIQPEVAGPALDRIAAAVLEHVGQ